MYLEWEILQNILEFYRRKQVLKVAFKFVYIRVTFFLTD